MKRTQWSWVILAFATALTASVGCSSSDNPADLPVDQVVEAGINKAITTTAVPVLQFMRAVRDIIIPPGAVAGSICPDTSNWCATGTVACAVTPTGLDFVFDKCDYVNAKAPLMLDGTVHANLVCCSTVPMHLTNLSIDGSLPNNGDGVVDPNACRYGMEIGNSDADLAGAIVQCDSDSYPTGETLQIYFGDYTVTVTLNGTNSVPAVATQSGNASNVVANCTINLDTLTSACDLP